MARARGRSLRNTTITLLPCDPIGMPSRQSATQRRLTSRSANHQDNRPPSNESAVAAGDGWATARLWLTLLLIGDPGYFGAGREPVARNGGVSSDAPAPARENDRHRKVVPPGLPRDPL